MSNGKFIFAMVLAVSMSFLSACAGGPKERSAGQSVDDTVLLARSKAALVENKDTKARDIDVEVYKGEVQLNGFVGSAQEKADAAATVKRIDGVRSVRNNLRVQSEERTAGGVIDDSVITTRVKAALIGDTRTKAYQIEVETKKGEVQLGGFVDSAGAKRAAEDIAASVEGVKAVTNGVEVKN
jgi:hyperosmotically inducible protein